MMVTNYTFTIMNRNEMIAEVEVAGLEVSVKKYNNNVAIQPFYEGIVTKERVDTFLKSRCFDASRPDVKDLLFFLGLNEYNPLAIVKKTHGRMFHDFLWIKFPNETLTWKDVANGQD